MQWKRWNKQKARIGIIILLLAVATIISISMTILIIQQDHPRIHTEVRTGDGNDSGRNN